MSILLVALLGFPASPLESVATLFVKAGPDATVPGRSKGQDRAIVLIHGLSVSPFSKDKVTKPHLRSWQLKDSILVKALGRQADVYALAYGQTVACDRISEVPIIAKHLRKLKKDGYREIILVGHSAGGLVARQLAEDHADLGITKVIQICTPNTGSGWAVIKAARSIQAAFLKSLTPTARKRVLEDRKDKRIPKTVEFACVVGSSRIGFHGDGVVSCKSQWSEDLQDQGIPAHSLRTTHWDAVRTEHGAELISRIVKEAQKRWDDRTVREMRKKLLGG